MQSSPYYLNRSWLSRDWTPARFSQLELKANKSRK